MNNTATTEWKIGQLVKKMNYNYGRVTYRGCITIIKISNTGSVITTDDNKKWNDEGRERGSGSHNRNHIEKLEEGETQTLLDEKRENELNAKKKIAADKEKARQEKIDQTWEEKGYIWEQSQKINMGGNEMRILSFKEDRSRETLHVTIFHYLEEDRFASLRGLEEGKKVMTHCMEVSGFRESIDYNGGTRMSSYSSSTLRGSTLKECFHSLLS